MTILYLQALIFFPLIEISTKVIIDQEKIIIEIKKKSGESDKRCGLMKFCDRLGIRAA